MKFWTFLLMVALLFVYAIIGAVIFKYIEINHENEVIRETNASIYEIIESRQCLTVDDVMELQKLVLDMGDNGISLLDDGSTVFRPKFDIRSSILIAVGLYAGFGIKNGVPMTLGGRMFSICYSVITGFYQFFVMYIIGDLFDTFLKLLYRKLMKKFKTRTFHWFFHFRQIILTVFGFIFLILIPSAIVHSIEPWSFGESLYFCFTYVITIGFGDFGPGSIYVVGQNEEFIQWYRMCVGFWLLISIIWFATVLFQFNSLLSSFIWETTEEVIEERVDRMKHAIHNTMRRSVRRRTSLRPQSNATMSSGSTTTTSTTSSSNPIIFPATPIFTVLGQESRGEVSVIRF